MELTRTPGGSSGPARAFRIWLIAGVMQSIALTAPLFAQSIGNGSEAGADPDSANVPQAEAETADIDAAKAPDADAAKVAPAMTPPAPHSELQSTFDDLPVTDTSMPESVEDMAGPEPPRRNLQAELAEAQSLYRDSFAADQHQPAIIAAEKMADLTAEIYGAESTEYAQACSDLAAAQGKSGDLAAAAANYRKAINLIEEQDGIVSPQLIRPLVGLAEIQNAAGEWDRGLETYNRALRLNNVELGLNNIEQMTIRDGLTESYLGLGSIADADFQQEVQMRITQDEFPNDLAKLTQASNKLAGWYRRSNQQEKEVLQLEMTVRIIRSKSGSNDTSQIKAIRDLAAAYQKLDLPEQDTLNAYNAAIAALKEAARINNESAKPDKLLDAEIQIDIGDAHNIFGATRDARHAYTQAWEILTSAGASQELLAGYFGTPVRIGSVDLPAFYPDDAQTGQLWRSNPDRLRPASLQALIDVDENGRTYNIRIIEANPPDLMEDRATYLLKRYRYRPRFENGAPVTTVDMPLKHNFSYLPEQNEDSAGDSAESDAALEYPGASD